MPAPLSTDLGSEGLHYDHLVNICLRQRGRRGLSRVWEVGEEEKFGNWKDDGFSKYRSLTAVD